MSEGFHGDSTDPSQPYQPETPEYETDIPNPEEYPLAAEFLEYCQEYQKGSSFTPEQLHLGKAFLAHSFMHGKVESMPHPYRRGWHTYIPARMVDRQIGDIHERYGMHDPEPSEERAQIVKNRTTFFKRHTEQALGYYNKFPEILGAYRLAEELRTAGRETEADSVDLYLTACGMAILGLPENMKKLPPGAQV